jgi:DNA (cytosine-5)-methyltransferase 1
VLTVGSLFSGIGGLDLGLERAGMRVLWQCESDPYCRAVLRKHWPGVPCYEDVRLLAHANGGDGGAEHGVDPSGSGGLPTTVDAPTYDGVVALATKQAWYDSLRVDVLCGGFPCQPVSFAGRRRGAADERWLWPEFARLIRLLRPRYALMENVPGLLVGGGMAEVLGDLAACGYDAEWDCVAAAHVGAPHLRYRVFILAYPNRGRQQDRAELDGNKASHSANGHTRRGHVDGLRDEVADAKRAGLGGWPSIGGNARKEQPATQRDGGPLADAEDADRWRSGGSIYSGRGDSQARGRSLRRIGLQHWKSEPDVGRVAHGVPSRVDRLSALGNAVVPQVAEYMGRLIVQAEEAV